MIRDLISVIVPVYNVEKYLNKCVECILNQTYQNLEILLINDGSTDNSGLLCDELAKKDTRIKVIHKKNEGLSATRNLGIEISRGEYIAFVDSDDYISNDFCETLLYAITQENSDISSIDLKLVREDGYNIVTSDDIRNSNFDSKLCIFNKDEIVKEILLRQSFKNYVCTKLYRRDIFKHCKFKEGISYEDILFMYEASKVINKIAYINKNCYAYLKRENSITATCSEKNLNDFLDIIMYRYQDIKNNNTAEEKYNIYALLESIISISIKHVIAGSIYKSVEEKSNQIFEIISSAIDNKELELELLPLLNDSQKACLYLILYNKKLFYNFLATRQDMKQKGTFLENIKCKPKICLLADVKGWAFDMIAQKIKKDLSYKYDIKIDYFDMYSNPDGLFECIEKNKDCDLIHVFWRKSLLLFESNAFEQKVQALGKNLNEYIEEVSKKISTCVYDYLYIDNEEDIKLYNKVFNTFSSNYYVSTKKLFEKYNSISQYKKPLNIIHDICDWEHYLPINLERFHPENVKNRDLVIGWVGNSERKVNGIDLKGLHTIIKPTIEELRNAGYNIIEHYADRNIKWRTMEEMPKYYSEIDICLCTSIHEGTPRPVLEAMSCGVPIITTDVGITREALGKKQQSYIIGDRNNGNNDDNIRKALKDIIINIYHNREILKELSDENLKSIVEYDGGKIIKEFDKFFDECLKCTRRNKDGQK